MYLYKYKDSVGKQRIVYSTTLIDLRAKEEEVKQDIRDGIKTRSENTLTVNDMFDRIIMKGLVKLDCLTRELEGNKDVFSKSNS